MIKKGLTYFLIITALLYLVRYLHYRGLLMQTQGYYAKYNTAFFERNTFDVLFLGSSRAEMHYDTRLFDSLTRHRSFNLSMAGATPHVAFAALKTYLSQSQPPAYLIYEVDYHALSYESHEVKEFNNYFPFLKHPVFRREMHTIDRRMNHFYYDPYFSLPFTGLKNLSTSLHGWLKIPNRTDSFYYHGFFKEVLRPYRYTALKRSSIFFNVTERNYLDSILLLCQKNKISAVLVSSPMFGGGQVEISNKPAIIRQLHNIASLHHTSYYDLSSLAFCNQRNLFVDYYHLNYAGARKFTAYFSRVFNNKIAPLALK